MRKVVTHILIILAFFIAVPIILNLLGLEKIGLIAVQYATLLVSGYLTILALKHHLKKVEQSDFKSAKEVRRKHVELFTSIGRDIDTDRLIYEIVGERAQSENIFSDMKILKQSITDKFGDDINDYRLLKDILELEQKQNFLAVLTNISKPLFTAIVTAFITTVIFNKIITKTNQAWDVYVSLSMILNIGYFVLFVFYAITMSYYTFHQYINRSTRFIKVLEIIIDEKLSENHDIKENETTKIEQG